MKLISNHLLSLPEFKGISKKMTVRINMAYVKDEKELDKFLKIPNDVFLDYPKGRTKPPTSTISISQAIYLAEKYKNIKYFAVSNIETSIQTITIKDLLPKRISLVPKIETLIGVLNLREILDCGIKYVMLDAEDLYTDCSNPTVFLTAKEKVKKLCKDKNIELLELYGVVFYGT